MATVYLAHDLTHEREVAIKVLHPHILPLRDSGVADGLLYCVMPYMRGETLRERLTRERQLPLDDARRLPREAVQGFLTASPPSLP